MLSFIVTVLLATLFACSNAFAASEQILWNFGLGNGDGQGPNGGLIRDVSGNLLGTTIEGGVNYLIGPADLGGTAFKLTPTGEESILWNFGGSAGGFSGPPDGVA